MAIRKAASDKKGHEPEPQDNDFILTVKNCFSRYAAFSGKASGKELWHWYLFACLITLWLYLESYILFPFTGPDVYGTFITLNGLWCLIIFLPSLALTVRRIHETGRSGWYCFIGIVPLLLGIVSMVILPLLR